VVRHRRAVAVLDQHRHVVLDGDVVGEHVHVAVVVVYTESDLPVDDRLGFAKIHSATQDQEQVTATHRRAPHRGTAP
jgi:hypothetical protein